jgi:hypothetical protein
MMEYEDLRSYMLKIHDLVLKLQETIKDREYDIKKLKEEVENQKTTIYKKNEEIIKLKADV